MLINKRVLNTVKCLLALLIVSLVGPTALSAEKADNADLKKSEMLTYSKKNNRNNDRKYQPVNCWKPYFTWIGNTQDQSKRTITQSTMGVGFLYFSNVNGNLKLAAAGPNQYDNTIVLAHGVGKIDYNRTPVFEWTYGYKVLTWLNVLFSVQNQSGINVQTEYVSGGSPGTAAGFGGAGVVYYQLRSQLGLNSLMLKVNFELPWVLVWKNWMYSAYLTGGVGPGWQSWTDNRVYVQSPAGSGRGTFANTLNQKYSANCVYQIDVGFRTKPAVLSSSMSILWGCKFNGWGQARSLGKLTQQGAWNQGVQDPFRVKTLYSFVPYLGFQWNF